MNIAAMTFHLRAPWVHSLKEKRMIVKSLVAKLQNRFHVSAAEVDERPYFIITPAIKCFQKDAPCKGPDCAEEEGGDAEASATDDDKAAGSLNKQISEIYSCRSNKSVILLGNWEIVISS